MQSQFVGDLKVGVKRLPEVEVQTVKFSSYDFLEVDGQLCVVGRGKVTYRGLASLKNSSLLFATISLCGQNPLPQFFSPPYLDSVIPTEKIRKWCDKYGLPYTSAPIMKNHHETGFVVQHFRSEVAKLYAYFLLWKALLEGNLNEARKYKRDVLLDPEIDLKEEEIPELKAGFAGAISQYFYDVFKYDDRRNTFTFTKNVHNLIHACYYQLACLAFTITSQEEYNKSLKNCENRACGNYFLPTGRQKYCKDCDRRTLYSRNHPGKREKQNHDRALQLFQEGYSLDVIDSKLKIGKKKLTHWLDTVRNNEIKE